MTLFLLAAAAMFAIVFWLILSPLLKKHDAVLDESNEEQDKGQAKDQADKNIAIGRERLRELKADLVAGQINNTQFEQMRSELEQTVLDAISANDRPQKTAVQSNNLWLMLVLTIGIPVLALGIYNEVGNTTFLNPESNQNSAQFPVPEGQAPDIEAMVKTLALRLKENPNDGEGWRMLGRSYMVLQRFNDSSQAYAKAYEILGEEVDLMVNYADALGRSKNSNLTGAAKPLINKALELDPEHGKARWLAGMLAYQEQDFETALAYLEPLLNQLEPDSEIHQGMSMLIARVKDASGSGPATSTQIAQEVPQANSEQPVSLPVSLQVSVTLDDSLQIQVSDDDTIFIFAKAISGPPMPLAVAKAQAKDLPLTVTLDDSSAMRPDLSLSTYDRVNISARISKSGNAIAASGDLQGEAKDIATSDQNTIEITINQQLK